LSKPAEALIAEIYLADLPKPVTEYRFHPTRKWRFDIAWVDRKLAVEVDGGVYVQGGHTRGKAYEGDREKDAEAMLLGWRILRVTPNLIRSGDALRWIRGMLNVLPATQEDNLEGMR